MNDSAEEVALSPFKHSSTRIFHTFYIHIGKREKVDIYLNLPGLSKSLKLSKYYLTNGMSIIITIKRRRN
jgi:hypothetical protein